MTLQLLVLVIVVVVSGTSMLRFRSRHFTVLAAACLAIGLTYWATQVGSHAVQALSAGSFPYDAAIMVVPVLGFSTAFAVLVAPPAVLVLERTGLLGTFWAVVVAGVLGALTMWFIVGQSPIEHPINLLVGAAGGLVFFLTWRHGTAADDVG